VAGVFLALHFATWIASLRYVSVARSTLLVCTAPVWAGIAGVFVPSLRPRPIFWLGLGIAAVGTWLVTATAKPVASLIEPAWLGDLLAVLGAICIVPYLMISQRLQKGVDTLTTVSWIYASAGAGLLGVLVLEGAAAPPTSSEVWIAILGMAVFAQLVGHSSLNWCLRHFSPTEVAASTLLEPVFAGALAWAILGESVGWLQGLGAAVLLVGVGISLSAPRAAPPLVTID
jgi:drug/metabolite transporter (DMT)-like permease